MEALTLAMAHLALEWPGCSGEGQAQPGARAYQMGRASALREMLRLYWPKRLRLVGSEDKP